jgi:rhomboid protease GluP
MGRFFCNTCGNVKCTCVKPTSPPEIQAVDPERTFLITNPETGVSEVVSQPEIEQNRHFNELLAATPLAWVTFVLIAINVAVFIAMSIAGISPLQPKADTLIPWGADYGPLTTHAQWWRLVTAIFVHAGIMHLAFNMFCFFRVGMFAERIFGNARFAMLYLLAGVGGNLASLYWHPFMVGVGASGAIFGVYGAIVGLMVSRPNLVPLSRAQTLTKDIVLFVGVNLLYGVMTPEVDVAAHIGGLVSGCLLGAALGRTLGRGAASIATVAAAMALLAGAAGLMPAIDDLQAEIKHLASLEKTTLILVNGSLVKFKNRELSATAFANIVESQALPPWNAERDRIAKLRIPPQESVLRERVAALAKYMSLRAEGWTLAEKGLLANDVTMIRDANRKQFEAQAVVQGMMTKKH